jgi:hypothetical protein
MSKIMSAPWVGLPGEFEPGAQRWCHYDCNVLGDPALKIWIDNPLVVTPELTTGLQCSLSPNPASEKVNLHLALNRSEDLIINLMNTNGMELQNYVHPSQTAGNHTYSIDLTSLMPGIYFIRVTTRNSSVIEKLMVVR